MLTLFKQYKPFLTVEFKATTMFIHVSYTFFFKTMIIEDLIVNK